MEEIMLKKLYRVAPQHIVEKKNKESSVVTISIKGSNQDKNNAILNEVLLSYRKDGLNDKNTVKSNTSNFIKERIKFLLEELNEVEITLDTTSLETVPSTDQPKKPRKNAKK